MLVMEIREGETPLQAALRYAEPYGLGGEVGEAYEKYVSEGQDPVDSALDALLDWDLLAYAGEAATPSPAPDVVLTFAD